MAQLAGATEAPTQFILPDTEHDKDTVFGLLKEKAADPMHYAVFIPGSAHDSKCWPHERFAQLAERLHHDYSLPVVAIGTESEAHAINQIVQAAETPIINLAGQTNADAQLFT